MVLAEWLSKRPILTLFPSLTAIIEFVRIKVKKIHESFALKKKDKTPGWFQFSQVTERFTGVMEA